MCDGILVKTSSGEHCIPIYRQVLHWPPGDPGPLRRVFDDIATIATINEAVAHIRNEGVRGQLAQAVQAGLKAVAHQLPAGVSVGNELLNVATCY